MPVNEEAFTHRNGRTARWEARGSSFLLLHAEERLPDYLPEELSVFELPEQTPKPAKPRWTTLYIGKGKKDKLNKVDIVGFLYKKGGLVGEDVGTGGCEGALCFRGSPPRQSKAIAYTAARGKNQGDEDFDRRSSLTVCYEAYPVMLLSMGENSLFLIIMHFFFFSFYSR